MSVPRHVNFITSNKSKAAELEAWFKAKSVTGIDVKTRSVDITEIQGTVEEIARDKCMRAAEAIDGPALTEDTCLYFDAWNGLPGPYVKSFVDKIGAARFHELLAGWDDRGAEAVCTFAYSEGPGKEPILFQGRTKGKIVEPRGTTEFGWDICFEYEGKTFAEMNKAEKSAVSHRGKALEKLAGWLQTQT